MPRDVEVEPGSFLVAEGPVKVRVVDGEALVCGGRCTKGAEFLVVAEKAVTIEAQSRLKLQVWEGPGSKLEKTEPTIPSEWLSLVEMLSSGGVAMVVGQVDSGKTFMTTYVANKLLELGVKVAVVDSDVGQSSIGPPATISMATLDRHILSLSDLDPQASYFVGSTTPAGHLLPMVVGTKKMVDEALKTAKAVMVDTTGMVYGGPARALKLYKAEAIRPSVVVLLERQGELDHLACQLKALGLEVFRVPASKWVKPRGRAERRALRERAFQRHFKRRGINELSLDLSRVKLVGAYVGTGRRADEVKAEVEALLNVHADYCELIPEGVVVVVDGRPQLRASLEALRQRFGEVIKVLRRGFEKGLLVGLLDKRGLLLEVGMLRSLDLGRGEAKVATPLREPSEVSAMKFGSLRLNDEFEEVERLEPGWL
ncbi:MAG: hypothetical protein DRJ97_00570 [Thermoprotei archaeon]|nr:MAG: hypothetical protein DRJ97_00570 [Thermoprotei archaeon]